MPDQLDDENDGEDAPGDDSPARVFHATELFGDSREVWIELDGVRYRPVSYTHLTLPTICSV